MDIIGHNKILDYLDKITKADIIHHAYLFLGPEHVGKFTVAMNWAEKILGNVSETNPDLIILRPEIEEKKDIVKKKAISIENVRELQRKLTMTPTNGKYKLAIIDGADYLNKSAQNALLKTLEEPPKSVILMLIAEDKEKLLPTILSRCQTERFNAVSLEEIAEMIPASEKGKEKIVFWSLGRPGLAKIFLEEKAFLEEREKERCQLERIFNQNVNEKFALAEEMGKNTVNSIEKLNWWMIILREHLMGKNSEIMVSRPKALQAIEKISQCIAILKNTNSNARLVLENLLLEF